MILGIYSASAGGKETFLLAEEINEINNQWSSYIFIDDTKPHGSTLWGYPVLSFNEVCSQYSPKDIEIVIAVGEPSDRELLYNRVREFDYHLATLVHPSIKIHFSTVIGDGVIINKNSFISTEVRIDDNVRIIGSVVVGHNSHIGMHSIIAVHSSIGGYVDIGRRSFLGLNVCVREHLHIGDDVIVSAGSAVLKDLPNAIIAQGNPARPILK